MQLWVGLGNPDAAAALQRHNVGFMALDAIAATHGFSPARQKFRGLVADGAIAGQRILAVKPQTYMNDSGESVQPAAAFHKIPPDRIVVFHDELDLAPGRVRVKRGGGNAGHNGLRSIDRVLGTADYWRVRIGIGHPGHKDRVVGYVLSNFAKAEQAWLAELLSALSDSAPLLAEARVEDFMTRVAALTQEPN
jgi:PTH1 family peptidyl-tRNA hydrolase